MQNPTQYDQYNQPFPPQGPIAQPSLTPGYNSTYAPTPAPASSVGNVTPQTVPAGQTTPVPPVGQVMYQGNPQAYVQQLIQQLGLKGSQTDPAALNQIVQGLKGRGVNASLAPAGSGGFVKGITIDGQFIKLVDGNNNWTWLPGGDGQTTGQGMAVDPSYLQPFGDQSQLSAFGKNLPQFQAPGAFQAPTGQDVLNDPGYQFRKDQTIGAEVNSKAAQGLFNSGGTVFDLGNLASNFASQEYGNVWNRDFSAWNSNWKNALDTNNASLMDYQNARDTYYANQQNPFGKLFNAAQLGQNAAANAG